MKLYFLFISLFLILSIKLVTSLTLTCEAGGPYATGSVVIVGGTVRGEVSNITKVTINITKAGTPKASSETITDTSGTYFSIFSQPFDFGTYNVIVLANNSTHVATCEDKFEVRVGEIVRVCEDITVSIRGKAYAEQSLPASGEVSISIKDLAISNKTSFSGNEFSISLRACLFPGKKYLLHLSLKDAEGRKGSIYIPFIPT